MFNIEQFSISEEDTLRCALKKIEINLHGIVFIINKQKKVLASLTDGDTRRWLLNGGNIEDQAYLAAEKNFTSAKVDVQREHIIKLLDNSVKVVPLLKSNGELADIATKNKLPLIGEKQILIQSRAPVRISFGGGGSDVSGYFEKEETGSVLNTTVNLYAHASLKLRYDGMTSITSVDLRAHIETKDINNIKDMCPSLGLIASLLEVIKPDCNFDLEIYSDFPPSSGLGGSSAVLVSIIGCFNELRSDRWTPYEIADLAYYAERHHFGIAGGWQDQYAAVFGGFNFMEFKSKENLIHPLKIRTDTKLKLEDRLFLCSSGVSHHSGKIHEDQNKQLKASGNEGLKNIRKNVDLCYKMRDLLIKNNLDTFGQMMDRAWNIKKTLSKEISNSRLDAIYSGALKSGAIGGKLLGAGGGGYFLFFVPPFFRKKFIMFCLEQKIDIQSFGFEEQGLQVWQSRV